MNPDMLEMLKKRNPGLRLYAVTDKEFEPYGRVLCKADNDLHDALSLLPIPAEGNTYTASEIRLEELCGVKRLGAAVFGGMEWQAGFCNGRGFTLNALEYHKCSEVNCSTTGCVLLLALPGDIRGDKLHSTDIVGFYLPPDVVAEIYPLTLHFAPCRVTEGGFNCLVLLERGVNAPLPRVDTSASGEEKMLWMRGKWLIAHKESPQAAKGAHVGIEGENIRLSI